jgi:hypothetical protein
MCYAMIPYIKRVMLLLKERCWVRYFAKNLRFNGNEYPTPRVNEAALLIYQIYKKLQGNKKGKEVDFSTLSRQVLRAAVLPYILNSDNQVDACELYSYGILCRIIM